MRTKELKEIQLIDKLLEKKRLTLNGKDGTSFMEVFNVKNIEDEDKSGNAKNFIHPRTLRRMVEDFYKEGIFVKDAEGFYSLNKDYFMFPDMLDRVEWKQVLRNLLDSGELEAYRLVQKHIRSDNPVTVINDFEMKQYAERVRDTNFSLSENQDVVRKINDALNGKRSMRVKYKNKIYEILPVCYVVSDDGMRKYLYALRRGKLLPPMELKHLSIMEVLNKKETDVSEHINIIRKAWNVEVQPPCYVKLAVRSGYDEEVEKVLIKYFGKAISNVEDYHIYEGEIIGINDFKTWIRSHIETCFVLEPEYLRLELVNSISEKIRRYEERK